MEAQREENLDSGGPGEAAVKLEGEAQEQEEEEQDAEDDEPDEDEFEDDDYLQVFSASALKLLGHILSPAFYCSCTCAFIANVQ